MEGENRMSIESAKAFLEKIKADAAFRKQVGEISSQEDRMAFVEKAGFAFTKEELDEVTGALSDEDLDAVAGGGWGCGVTHEGEYGGGDGFSCAK